MTQPDLFTLTPPRIKKAGHVRETSRQVRRDLEQAGTIHARERQVFELLSGGTSAGIEPTSAELARVWRGLSASVPQPTQVEANLFVRRGLSDLSAKGLVEAVGKRTCTVSGKTCLTWRVK